jgi:hypothetical protein
MHSHDVKGLVDDLDGLRVKLANIKQKIVRNNFIHIMMNSGMCIMGFVFSLFVCCN